MQAHKHCDVIKKWADGWIIEFYDPYVQMWKRVPKLTWDEHTEYRAIHPDFPNEYRAWFRRNDMKKVSIVSGLELKAHIEKHATLTTECSLGGFYTVKKEMHVFKKVLYRDSSRFWHDTCPAIANLILPVGTEFYALHMGLTEAGNADAYRKMRADRARVHSIVELTHPHKQQPRAYSWFNGQFLYRPGEFIVPNLPFSKQDLLCESGIHFFINVQDAIDYVL